MEISNFISSVDGTVQPISKQEVTSQQTEFAHLLQKLGNISSADVEIALAEREVVESESELTSEIIAQFQLRIQNKKSKK